MFLYQPQKLNICYDMIKITLLMQGKSVQVQQLPKPNQAALKPFCPAII